MHSATSRKAPLAAFALALAAALVLISSGHSSARHHVMTPAIGSHPLFRLAGQVPDAVTPHVTFGCQTRPIGAVRCYSPAQIQTAYHIAPLLAAGTNGSGRTIVIVDAFQSPTITQDLAIFDSVFGLPNPTLNIIAPDGLTPFDPNSANQASWAGEITLDVEWAHAIAPHATIDLVLAKSNDDADILSATKYAVDHSLGDVISQSFGENESCMDPALVAQQHALFDTASAKGITLFASSGDLGAAQLNCAGTDIVQAASTPASDPDVTGVGGTQLSATFPAGDYQSETTWNESTTFGSAGGGGYSVLYKRPDYQSPVQKNKARGVPDVAYDAAIDGGVLAVWTCPPAAGAPCDGSSTFVFIFGGTSAGSPQWAGLTALADQLNGGRVGDINKTLYKLGKSKDASTSFHDITTGNNAFFSVPGFAAGPGWDAATGLGSPIADTLVPAIAGRGH